MTNRTEGARKRGRLGKIRALLVALVIGFAALTLAGLFGAFDATCTVLFAGLLMVAGFAHLMVAFRLPTRRRFKREGNGGRVSLKSIRNDSVGVAGSFEPEQIRLYAKAVLQPREMRGRLIEEIEPLKRALRQRVSITVDMPNKANGLDLLFPVLMPVKGELQDDLRISLDGAPVTTLTHREYLLLTAVVLEALLVPGNGLTAEQCEELAGVTDDALTIVARRGRFDSSGDMAKITECAEAIDRLAKDGGESFRLAASLVRRLAQNYVIVVIIPGGGGSPSKRLVAYERYIIPSLRLARWTSLPRWIRDHVRTLLGARPVFLELPLLNAATAQSYHLQVMGPDGMYVGWQDVQNADDLFSNQSLDEDLTRPYARFQRRKGQRYLHLYTRSVPESQASQLRLDVRFYEVPPGSAATTALAALTNCALVFVVAFVLQVAKSPLGSDFPAVVLAFPAIAGAFAGFESRATALVGGVLSSKASALLTIMLSLAASGLFMANSAHALELTDHPAVLGIRDIWWQILAVTALVNTLYSSYVWLARTLSFSWLAHRPGDDAQSGPSER